MNCFSFNIIGGGNKVKRQRIGNIVQKGKRKLWRSLIDLKRKLRARCWIVGGDFNFVVCKEERNDVRDSRRDFEMIEFSSFVEEMNLIDVPSIDGVFTWINSA
ncbi:hypothetical protein KIW84_034305 [Lathyrus oleraceus]|uniref:Uncharacterized protein n=1 Tax=Pisum sativum TaxID=3888 RepID=A0A9D4Y0X9_PEA|nr:hypothetical protein KIW84_034305 [Pisum sativum]